MTVGSTVTVTKLDAARRELRTAIELWFNDGDPVSIHALVYSAHEIIHVISRHRKRDRDLLFDSIVIKDEYRSEWSLFLKQAGNFFKHADKDPEGSIDFNPALSELFIFMSILGVRLSGETLNDAEEAFNFWTYFHKPNWLTPKGRERFVESIPVDHLENIRRLPKNEFFKVILAARRIRANPGD